MSKNPCMACIFSLNLVTTPAFLPIIDGAPSVARPLAHATSNDSIQRSNYRVENVLEKFLFDSQSLSTPRMNMASWATSTILALSSIATENARNDETLGQLAVQICWELGNLVCNGTSRHANIGKSLLLLRTHNFGWVFDKLPITVQLWC